MPKRSDKEPKWKTDPFGEFVIRFCNTLCGSGDYMNVPTPLIPYQEEVTRRIFADRTSDGRRRIKKVFLALPRKAGKTSLVSKWVVTLLVAEGKTGQFIVTVSGCQDQASQTFEYVVDARNASPYLKKRLKVNYNQKKIVDRISGNVFQALTSDGNTKLGKNISTALFDEGAFWEDDTLHRAITTSMGARKERLIIYLSTAGFNPYGWYKREWDHAVNVRDGVVKDPSYLPVIFAAGPTDDPWDEATWHKAHPALGKFYEIEQMREDAETAKHFPDLEAWFKTVYLNIWSNAGEKWLSHTQWQACRGDHTWESLEGQECYGGLDLAPVHDLSSLVLAFPQHDGTVKVLCRTWIPGSDIEARSKRDRVPYKEWMKAKEIIVTPGKTTQFGQIEEDIKELSRRYIIRGIVYDRAYAYQVAEHLREAGIECDEFPQTIQAFSPACKYLERLIRDEKIRHDGNRPLSWCLGNAVAYRDNNDNVRPDKKRSTEKIDALVAMVMALGLELNSQSGIDYYNPFDSPETAVKLRA